MSDFLSEFFRRRSEGLQRQKSNENNKKIDENIQEEKVLSDQDFWDIVNEFNRRGRQAKNEQELKKIMEEILMNYEDWQIEQFVIRFEELSK